MLEARKEYSLNIDGKKLVLVFGDYTGLAESSCLVRFGDTVINVAVTVSSKPKEEMDFFPLSVDYEEKFYASGRIPESFSRREGKPSERAILTSRLIDRSIRPLFPKDFRNEVSVVCTVLSIDTDYSPEIASLIGASAALSVSEIPWDGPIGAVNVGLNGKKIVFNPSIKQQEKSSMLTTVVSTRDLVAMLESSAKEVSNDTMLKCIKEGHKFNQKIVKFLKKIKKDRLVYLFLL